MKITAGQIRKIHFEARQRGLDGDQLRELLDAEVGLRSVKALTLAQAAQVIDRLIGRPQPTYAATVKQICLMRGLARELGWTGPERLRAFCERMFKIGDPWMLEVWQASNIIEALKVMTSRSESGPPPA